MNALAAMEVRFFIHYVKILNFNIMNKAIILRNVFVNNYK
jgi:hypothetical protein